AWRLPPLARRLRIRRGGVAIVVGAVMLLTLWVVSLPFGLAALWWQHRWGLAPFDVRAWLSGQRSSLLLDAVTGLLTALAVVALAGRFGRRWWIPGGALFSAIAVAFAFVGGWLDGSGHRIRSARLRADVP